MSVLPGMMPYVSENSILLIRSSVLLIQDLYTKMSIISRRNRSSICFLATFTATRNADT